LNYLFKLDPRLNKGLKALELQVKMTSILSNMIVNCHKLINADNSLTDAGIKYNKTAFDSLTNLGMIVLCHRTTGANKNQDDNKKTLH
jgi:hypothetical protein